MKVSYCCPWHDEQTPSCCVDTDANRVVCLGCGHEATVGEFLQQMNQAGRRGELQGLAVQMAQHVLDTLNRYGLGEPDLIEVRPSKVEQP